MRAAASARRAGRLLTLTALALTPASCGEDSEEAPLPPRAKTVEVSMKEYRFTYEAPRSPGRVVLHARNAGRQKHELILLELPHDFPPIREQVRGRKRRLLGTLAYVKAQPPRGRGVLAVDLPRGRYAMVCLRDDRRGSTHARRGMTSEFRIR